MDEFLRKTRGMDRCGTTKRGDGCVGTRTWFGYSLCNYAIRRVFVENVWQLANVRIFGREGKYHRGLNAMFRYWKHPLLRAICKAQNSTSIAWYVDTNIFRFKKKKGRNSTICFLQIFSVSGFFVHLREIWRCKNAQIRKILKIDKIHVCCNI